jgi:hypothetical protein
MLWVVAPVDQAYSKNPDPAFRFTLPPAQKVVGPEGVIVGEGLGFTVTVREADPGHPKEFVTVTE